MLCIGPTHSSWPWGSIQTRTNVSINMEQGKGCEANLFGGYEKENCPLAVLVCGIAVAKVYLGVGVKLT